MAKKFLNWDNLEYIVEQMQKFLIDHNGLDNHLDVFWEARERVTDKMKYGRGIDGCPYTSEQYESLNTGEKYEGTFVGVYNKNAEQDGILDVHEARLNDQEERLNIQEERLNDHERTLEAHGATLNEHSGKIDQHGKDIAKCVSDIAKCNEGLEKRYTKDETDREISTAVDNLESRLLGDDRDQIEDTYETMKGIADWIKEHGKTAADLMTGVSQNRTDIDTIQGILAGVGGIGDSVLINRKLNDLKSILSEIADVDWNGEIWDGEQSNETSTAAPSEVPSEAPTSAPTEPPVQQTYEITGFIKNNGEPLEGVEVVIKSFTGDEEALALTDEYGEFRVDLTQCDIAFPDGRENPPVGILIFRYGEYSSQVNLNTVAWIDGVGNLGEISIIIPDGPSVTNISFKVAEPMIMDEQYTNANIGAPYILGSLNNGLLATSDNSGAFNFDVSSNYNYDDTWVITSAKAGEFPIEVLNHVGEVTPSAEINGTITIAKSMKADSAVRFGLDQQDGMIFRCLYNGDHIDNWDEVTIYQCPKLTTGRLVIDDIAIPDNIVQYEEFVVGGIKRYSFDIVGEKAPYILVFCTKIKEDRTAYLLASRLYRIPCMGEAMYEYILLGGESWANYYDDGWTVNEFEYSGPNINPGVTTTQGGGNGDEQSTSTTIPGGYVNPDVTVNPGGSLLPPVTDETTTTTTTASIPSLDPGVLTSGGWIPSGTEEIELPVNGGRSIDDPHDTLEEALESYLN